MGKKSRPGSWRSSTGGSESATESWPITGSAERKNYENFSMGRGGTWSWMWQWSLDRTNSHIFTDPQVAEIVTFNLVSAEVTYHNLWLIRI